MMFVGLAPKKVIVLHPDGEKEYKFPYPKAGKRPCFEAIGDFLAKRPEVTSFMSSSSVNHPHEYGFTRDFDISEVMGKARRHAFQKLAIRVPPGPLDQAVKTLEAASKAYGRFPLPILFEKSSRKGEDALLVFEAEELEQFLSGIMYASNLVELTKDPVQKLREAVDHVNKHHPLPRCGHGNALKDHGGNLLEPSCGCRSS